MSQKPPKMPVLSFLVWCAGILSQLRGNAFRKFEKLNPETSGYKRLLKAVSLNEIETVKQILQESPDAIAPKSPWKDWPLTIASGSGYIEIVEELLNHGASPDGGVLDRPIIAAALENQSKVISLLARSGANLELFVEHKETAVYWAAAKGNFEALKTLVELGANVNFRSTDDSCSPLLAAKPFTEIYEYLLPFTEEEFRKFDYEHDITN